MADNYIEKKFEEYKKGCVKKMRMPKKQRAVFIADGLTPEGEEAVRKYSCEPEVAVAFAGADRKRGNALAQATGSRFYLIGAQTLDMAISAARAHWPGIPLEVFGDHNLLK